MVSGGGGGRGGGSGSGSGSGSGGFRGVVNHIYQRGTQPLANSSRVGLRLYNHRSRLKYTLKILVIIYSIISG